MPQQSQKLIIDAFQGVDVERGVLERPVNSFKTLENFDLVKPGVIRKIRGNRRLGQISTQAVVALRDYQADPGGAQLRVAVDNNGLLYFSNNITLPFQLAGSCLPAPGLLNEAPFVVSLPLGSDIDNTKRNYIFVTVGSLGSVVKWNGTTDPNNITPVGVENPTDSWSQLYQHSAATPAQMYTHPTAGRIFEGTTPNVGQGISCAVGLQYRWSWYNPITKHDSSLAALSLQQFRTDIITRTEGHPEIPSPPTKPLGTMITVPPAQFVMAVPILLQNEPNSYVVVPITPPSPDYTQIRFWRTKDGAQDFWLLPRLYDNFGRVITDADGAINITDIDYGFPLRAPVILFPKVLWDGFWPHANSDNWVVMLPFDAAPNYTVTAANQTGNSLQVTLNTGEEIANGQFMLESDAHIYVITAIQGAGPTFFWSITPPIQIAPPAGSRITILGTLPVQDQELVIPFVTQQEVGIVINTDRLNDPPPKAIWGVVYQNRLVLQNAADPTQLHYSRIGQYESFPPDNVFRFTQADFDPITALLTGRQVGLVSQGADAQLVVGKERSSAKITGTDLSTFAIQTMFAETGIVHKRAAVVMEGYFMAWTRRGLESLEPQQPVFIGTKIKDIFDAATFGPVGDRFGPSFTTYRKEGQLLLGVNLNRPPEVFDPDKGRIDTIILMRPIISEGSQNVGGQIQFGSPFSFITALPDRLGVLLESGFGDNVVVLAGANDGFLYQLFYGGDNQEASATSPVVGVVETQELPQDDKDSRKVFRRVRFDGNAITGDSGWKIEFSVDGSAYTAPRQMYTETLIGLVGRQLSIRIVHDRSVPQDEDVPQISNMMVEYTPIGEARADAGH